MKILLLQDEIYLPCFGGGIKANRRLLEALAGKGHECRAVCPAFTPTQAGPHDQLAFMEEMARRRIIVRAPEPHVFAFTLAGVQVEALALRDPEAHGRHGRRRIEEFQPDWVLVNDDKRRFLLETAVTAAPGRVVLVLQTVIHLPFGPLAVQPGARQAELVRQARGIVVISDFLRRYVRQYGGLEARLFHLPVYEPGPFANLGRFDDGFVTLVNPCSLKGLPLFLQLAREFPQVPFAAVPTWGATDQVLAGLSGLPNVRLLPPTEDTEQLWRQTRVLLVPSLWPETFGYVVPEAMLRGIPVMASNVGGLPEAKLGVDYLLPVTPAELHEGAFRVPPQDVRPWADALKELLSDRECYERCSAASHAAAGHFASAVSVNPFEEYLTDLAPSSEAEMQNSA